MNPTVAAHDLKLARRMSRLGTETAFEVLARARALEAEGRTIVHLEIGEPDFDTPANVIDVGCAALREAIAADASARRGLKFSSAEVVVTPGAKPIIFYALMALVNEGDEVIY